MLLGVYKSDQQVPEQEACDRRIVRAYLVPLADVLVLAILEHALVMRDAILAVDKAIKHVPLAGVQAHCVLGKD